MKACLCRVVVKLSLCSIKRTIYRMHQLKVWPDLQDGFVVATSELLPLTLVSFSKMNEVVRFPIRPSLLVQELLVGWPSVPCETGCYWVVCITSKAPWPWGVVIRVCSLAHYFLCWSSWLIQKFTFQLIRTSMLERWFIFFLPGLFFLPFYPPYRSNVQFRDIWASPNTSNVHCVYPFSAAARGDAVSDITSGEFKQWKQMVKVIKSVLW